MLLIDLLKKDEIYFLDIETVNNLGICQIGITKWSRVNRKLSLEFNEILNPDVPADSINIHAISKHTVSEYQWSKAQTFAGHYTWLRELLHGKVVIQWGGDDVGIIKKNISRYKLESLQVTSLNSWDYHHTSVSLDDAIASINIKRPDKHHAALDSYLTGLLFVNEFVKYDATKEDLEVIRSLGCLCDSSEQPFRVSALTKNGLGKEVYLSGFTDKEKIEFGTKLAEMGFKIRSGVTKELDFLIIPSGFYNRSPGKEAKAKDVGAQIIDLDTFLRDISKLKAS